MQFRRKQRGGVSAEPAVLAAAEINVERALVKLCEWAKKKVIDKNVVQLLRRTYRGARIYILHIKGSPLTPSFTVHYGWLVMGLMPHNLKAFVRCASTPATNWKLPPVVPLAIQQGLKAGNVHTKLGYLSVSDPRPMLEILTPLAPPLVQAASTEMPRTISHCSISTQFHMLRR